MSDLHLRELERAAREGDPTAFLRHTHALLRDGRLDRTRFDALAQLNDAWTLEVLGLRARPDHVQPFGSRSGCRDRDNQDRATTLCHDVRCVRTVSREAALRACLAACRPIRRRPEHSVRSNRDRSSRRAVEFAERRLLDGPATWTSRFLWERDRRGWEIECDLNALGYIIDAWSMLLHGFEDEKDWSGARCVIFALGERGVTDEVVRADMIRELRAWALTEIPA